MTFTYPTWVIRAVSQHKYLAVQRKRIDQLEEAIEKLRSSFESRMERAAGLVDEGELNDYWRGNRDALQVCLHGLAVLCPSKEVGEE